MTNKLIIKLLILTLLGSIFAIVSYKWFEKGLKLGINLTDSEIPGIYLCNKVKNKDLIPLNSMVSFNLPQLKWLENRHYVNPNDLLIKHIGAIPGEYLFTKNKAILACSQNKVDGKCRTLGNCLTHDSHHYSIHCQQWNGYKVPSSYYYMQSIRSPLSFDSRYFGLIHASNIKHSVALLWGINK